MQEFDAIDWKDGGAKLQADGWCFKVFVSPYSLACQADGQLVSVSRVKELEEMDIKGKIVLLHGEIAKEQLMPKNFVFYNPAEHQQIISLLEKGKPEAIICATGRNAALAGGVYPFPLIEDGDFDIPSVYMTEAEGSKLLPCVGRTVVLESISTRIPGKGYNVIARKGKHSNERIVITAHIDAKKGTPGAIDNATGVVVLLLLAKLLGDYDGNELIEIVALNGEDYYAVPGQMLYINKNQDRFDEILLNINIDGAGYKKGKSTFSFYGLPEKMDKNANDVLSKFSGIIEGVQWPQGDHSIFIQNGRPAIAVSSEWFTENIDSQEITHTPKDNIGIVDCKKVVEIAEALNLLVRK
jgi:aminopeptidase YwaD